MEGDGIIEKRIVSENPWHVSYSLSDLGISLLPVLKEMEKWGKYYKEQRR